MFDTEDVDVGKTTHHGHGLTTAGKKALDKQLPNSEPTLRAVGGSACCSRCSATAPSTTPASHKQRLHEPAQGRSIQVNTLCRLSTP